jgi:hypothetical protein
MWITNTTPSVPNFESWNHRVESAPVLIQTRAGHLYMARWVVYEDADFGARWELEGRDGLQIEPEDVAAWQSITPYEA